MQLPGRRAWLGVVALGAIAATLVGAARADESWDAVYIGGSKVGFTHLRVMSVTDKDRKLINVQFEQEIDVNRSSDRLRMKLRYGTIETPEGEVLRLDTRVQAGRDELRTHGDVIDGKMDLKVSSGGREQRKVIDWPADIRGPYAAELSLARSPIKVGETRQLKMFIPILNVVAKLDLVAKGVEDVELGGGVKRPLMKVESIVTMPDGKVDLEQSTTFWVDNAGQALKQYASVFGGSYTYRTSKQAAMATDPGGRLDLIALSVVKVTQKIPRSELTRNISYRLRFKGNDPAQFFPTDRRQEAKSAGDGTTATLLVRTAGPQDGQPEASPGDEFLRSNPMINSEDPSVVRLAAKATASAGNDPWAKAVAIQQFVFKTMKSQNFRTAFAPAHEVARTLEGDCTEFGVLTAAMCRASGIPARVAVGLVYGDSLGGFGFHMWNEVYVNQRWVAIDSIFNQSEVDATHLKLSDASLDGVSPYETFTSVAKVFGNLTIEPVEIR
ncbi:transglutaminase-like domain-containing protein [Isosphaeraceae bacterium EP7]